MNPFVQCLILMKFHKRRFGRSLIHPVLLITATTVYKQQSLVCSRHQFFRHPSTTPFFSSKFLSFFSSTPYDHWGGGGGSYSELEPSLGFKPPLQTASQVLFYHFPGKAEWAGELVKDNFLSIYLKQHTNHC